MNTNHQQPTSDIQQTASPYKGLAPYDVTDKDNFFGRDREKQILLGKMFANNVTLLFAGTGVGKSSLLRAAIIPTLTEQRGLDVVYYADWVTEPVDGLKTKIQEQLITNQKITGRELKLSDDLPAFLETCTAYASEPLILMLDQFEELFQYHARSGRLIPFVEQIAQVINAPDLAVRLVFAMREDFLADLNVFKGRMPSLFDNHYRLEELQLAQAREAIEKPLQKEEIGFRYEDGLVDELLHDLAAREQEHTPLAPPASGRAVKFSENACHGEESSTKPSPDTGEIASQSLAMTLPFGENLAALGIEGGVVEPPYLQIVCNELWRAEKDNPQKVITRERYVALGRTTQIVRKHFEQAMQHFSLRQQSLAFEMFRYLVTERGTKMAYRAEDLASAQLLGVPVTEIEPILAYLASKEVRVLRADQRLDQTWYELYHDVFARIIRDWTTQFQADENRRIYRQITTAARKWAHDDANLLRGTALLEAKDWLKDNRAEALAPDEQTFLRQSLKQYTRKRWLQLVIVTAIATFTVIAMILGLYANQQNQEAQRQREAALRQSELALEQKAMAKKAQIRAETKEQEAKEQAELVFARKLESLALLATYHPSASDGSPVQGVLLAAQALKFSNNPQTLQTLQRILEEKTTLYEPIGKVEPGQTVTLSADAMQVVRDETGHTQIVLNNATTILAWTPYGHRDTVNSVAFSPDGKQVVSGSADNTLILWDTATGQPIAMPWKGHQKFVYNATFRPDGKQVVSGSADNTLILWDTATGQPIGMPWQGHTKGVYGVAFSPDGKQVVSGSADNTLILWDVATGKPLGTPWQGHTAEVSSVTFSPDGKQVVSGSADNTLILWDVATSKPLGISWQGHTAKVSSVAFSPDGKQVVSGSYDNTLILWDATTGRQIRTLEQGHQAYVESVAFGPDGKWVISGSKDKTLILWDATTGQPVGTPWKGHQDIIYGVAFSPNGQQVISGSADKTLILWDISTTPNTDVMTGKPKWQGHAVISVALRPDGKQAISANENNTLILWDTTTHNPIEKPWQGHQVSVNNVAFSPDGKQVVSGNDDATLMLWNVDNGQPIGTPWHGHQTAIASVAFNPDGNSVISVDTDGQILRWPIPPNGWIELVCRKVERGLLHSEWQRFIGETRPYETICQEQWAASRQTNRRAIMIGIDNMQNSQWNLEGCVNDATMVQEILQTFGKMNPQNTRLVKDTEATQANLIYILKDWLPTQAGPEDTVIIYYAGHGSQVRDRNGDETEDAMDEILVPHDLNWDDPLTDDLIREWLKNVHAQVVLILDIVSSGGFADDFADLDHVTVLAGCQANQQAQEKRFEGTAHGAFTYYLAQGLQGNADLNHDRRVTVSEAFEYTKQQLKKDGFTQIPVLKPGREDVVLTWLKDEDEFVPSVTFDQKDILGVGLNLIKAGNIEAAQAIFQRILERHPSARLDLTGILAEGENAAKAGDLDLAKAIFHLVKDFDPGITFDPQTEAQKLAAPGLVEQGEQLARAGKIAEAIALFEQARAFDPGLELDPKAEAQKLAAPGLVEQGQQLALTGKIAEAIAIFKQAQMLDPNLTLDPQTGFPKMNRQAIMIGIDQYQKSDYNLKGCVNDALVMQEILQEFGKMPSRSIRLVKDEEATQANLTHLFQDWLPNQTSSKDTVIIIYYSGRSSQVRDRNGDESEDQLDEILAPYDLNWDDPLTDDLVREWLKNLQANVVLILDACYLGGFADDFADLDHVTVLAGCQANQEAQEKRIDGQVRGAFSYFLSRGLEGAADRDGDRLVTVSEAFEYTKQQLKKDGFTQIPVLKPGREDVVLTWLDDEPVPSATVTPTVELLTNE